MPTIPQGINGLPRSSLPGTYEAFRQWFPDWVKVRLANADIRNATPGTGISIDGTVATPATVSVASPITNLLHEPYLLAVAPPDDILTAYRLIEPESDVLTVSDGGALGSFTLGVAPNGIGNIQLRQGAAVSVIGNPTGVAANVADIAATADGQVLTRAAGVLAFSVLPATSLAAIANNTVLGNVSGSSASPAALTQTQLTALINAFSSTLSGAVPLSGGGTSNYLRADGTWDVPSGTAIVPTSANPSATIGLSAVDGSAATFMTSDSAPALSQAIAPTWTGAHVFTPSGANPAITINGGVNQNTEIQKGSATSGQSFGPLIEAGTTSADYALAVFNQSATSLYFEIRGDGAVAFHGAAPQAQSTGWGTPTGASVENNFAGGSASLATCTAAVAEIIAVLKGIGLFGA